MATKEEILARISYKAFYRQELGVDLLKLRGDEVQVLCPFHDDKNPSLSINIKTGLFNCFACGASGDVFTFYQRYHDCNFTEALTSLACFSGLEEAPVKPAGYLNLPLKEFALAKRLAEDHLQRHNVQQFRFPDGTVCVDFPYRDISGKVVAIRHRFANKGDKKFRWRKGDRVTLYGLEKWQQILAAGWCLIVEGETDCLTCWLHGIPALGLPGKKTWKKCRKALKELELKVQKLTTIKFFLWQEPDALELPHEVVQDLPDLLVIQSPDEFKDLSEAHCQGRDVKSLVEQLKTRAYNPQSSSPPPVVDSACSMSDLGNAKRLVARHGRDLHYSFFSKKWYYWAGTHWVKDDHGEVERRAKETVANIYHEAAWADSTDERKKLAQFALRSEQVNRIMAMVRLAQSEPGIPISPAQLDANPWLFNCKNGTIDLTTGERLPHRRENLITCLAPVEYDPDFYPELWEKFLYQIMDVYARPEAAERMVQFLQRALGYSLTGSCREECLFMLWGGGANGKSTLVKTVSTLLGDYARNTPVETLLSRQKGGEIPADVARLDGPRFVMSSEVDRGRRLAESLVKALTGRDTISARYLYAEFFDFEPQFKLWLSTNYKPVIRGVDNAIWRRIIFIEFPVQIPKEKWDENLRDKLIAEGPGILPWMVRGGLNWQQDGLKPPPEVLEATAQYRAEMDVLADFLTDCCVVVPTATVTVQAIYEAYCNWAEAAGLREKEMLKQRTFGSLLQERGFRRDKGTAGQRIWRGVGLRSIN